MGRDDNDGEEELARRASTQPSENAQVGRIGCRCVIGTGVRFTLVMRLFLNTVHLRTLTVRLRTLSWTQLSKSTALGDGMPFAECLDTAGSLPRSSSVSPK